MNIDLIQFVLGLLLLSVVIYFLWIYNKNKSKLNNIKKELDPQVAQEMAQKILKDAKMHRAATRKDNEK
jgi:hypothetical protein|tara:strand:- start:375 stop:581 length:207 start_codon:yes stop_codon:yes gene_type:complete